MECSITQTRSEKVKVQDIPLNPNHYLLLLNIFVKNNSQLLYHLHTKRPNHPRQALNEDTDLPQTSVPIPNVPNEVVYKEWDDSVERATTTASSLDAAHDSGNILKAQSTRMPNVPLL
nr:hypothetical protein [Tanacetum cinerariifolium]